MSPDVLARLDGGPQDTAGRVWAEAAAVLSGLVRTADADAAARRITGEISRVIATVAAPARPPELDAVGYRRRAARHGALLARRDVPLAGLITAYQCCAGVVLGMLWTGAGVGDGARLQVMTRATARWIGVVAHHAADGYATELTRLDRTDEAPSALAEVLLSGYVSDRLARCAAVRVAERYRLLIGRGTGAAVEPWRTAEITRVLRGMAPVLSCEHEGDLVVLVPEPGSVEHPVEREAVALLTHPLVTGVHWATVDGPASVGDLPATLKRARSTAQLARAAGLPAGRVARPEDVAIEVVGVTDPEVEPMIAEIGGRLAAEPELLRTVAALYRLDLDRTGTAAHLGITRRTLYNRLDRIRLLTGIGPTTSAGIRLLGLGLTLQQLRTDEAGA